MKNLFHHLPKLAAVAAIALSVSSCNRAEYAMLPKTTPYHATYGHVAKAAPAPVASQPEVVATEISTPEAPATPAEATPAPTAVATSPAAPAAVATAAPAKAAPAPAARPAAAAATAAPRKLNLVQRMALSKITKKADQLASKMQRKQSHETAEASRISGYLRTGIILVLVGAIITLLPGGIFDLIGGIIAIVGLLFIVLWLLDEL